MFRGILCAVLVVCLVLAQEALSNESILKLLKAGMGEDVIVGMVNSQPGRYTVTPMPSSRLSRCF